MRIVVSGLVLAALCGAATGEPRPVSFRDVLAALPRAPAAAIGAHDIAAAEATADAAGAWPSPTVKVATNTLTSRLVAGISLPLPLFGTVGAARTQARAESRVVRAEADLALRDVRHRGVAAWVALARADGEVVTSAIAAQQAAELLLIANGRKDAGVGADVDITAANAAKARADVAASAAVRAQLAASATLAGVLGWDPAQPLRSDGQPETGAHADLAQLRTQLAQHPEHHAAEARIVAAAAAVDQARSQRWPGLALEGEYDYDDPTTEHKDNYVIGLSLDVPVFARTGDRIAAARATEAAQRARLAAMDSELGANLAAAFEKWQAAAETLAALERDVVPAQERAAALSAQAYREGARDLASALQAERDLAAVRAEVTTARAEAALAWEDLQLAAGQ